MRPHSFRLENLETQINAELQPLIEIWREEMKWLHEQELEQRMKLYKKYLWAKTRLKEEIDWIID